MAQYGSNQPLADNQRRSEFIGKVAKIVKAVSIGSTVLVFSPVLIIFSPLLVTTFFFYWAYCYITEKHPIGADQVDRTLEKVAEMVERVKNKVEQLGKVGDDGASVGVRGVDYGG